MADVFTYNKKNLASAKKMRGFPRANYLDMLEHNRTKTFKKQPKKAKRLGITGSHYGKWIKRKKPINKIKGLHQDLYKKGWKKHLVDGGIN